MSNTKPNPDEFMLDGIVYSTKALRQEWETPPEIFRQLDNEVHFGLDVSANATNKKCPYFYGPGSRLATNALDLDVWGNDIPANGMAGSAIGPPLNCFCNPGFSDPMPWHIRAARTARELGTTVVVLGLVGASQEWYEYAYINASEHRKMRPRPEYIPPTELLEYWNAHGIKQTGNNREGCSYHYGPKKDWDAPAVTRLWKWKEGVVI